MSYCLRRARAFCYSVRRAWARPRSSAAPDLLSVATVLSVTDEPFAASETQLGVINAYRRDIEELEQRHGITTEEFISRLLAREPMAIAEEDVARWRSACEVLRKVGR